MEIILLSDTHLLWHNPTARIDDVKETQFKKWHFILEYAKKNNAIILEGGDFFNSNRSWYLLPKIMDLLKQYNIPIYCVFGQHDTYLYSEENRESTSLGILEKAELIKILNDKPSWFEVGICKTNADKNIYMYGCSYGQDIPEIKTKDHFNILVIHAPIAEHAIYPNQKYMDALTFLKDHEFDLILAADIHQKYMIEHQGRYIVNSGPLIRKEATLYNFSHKPGFYIFDTESQKRPEFIEVPHALAEDVLSRNHIDYEKENKQILEEFINSIEQQDIEEGVSFIENLWGFMKANNISKNIQNILSEVTQS